MKLPRLNPNRVPWTVWFFSRTGAALLRLRVPCPRVERYVGAGCFYTSQVFWVLREPWAFLRAQPAALREAEGTLPVNPTAGQRAILYVSFALVAGQTALSVPGIIGRGLRDEHRAWKARGRL